MSQDGSEGSDGDKRGISWNVWNPTASLCDENVVSWEVWERLRRAPDLTSHVVLFH